MYLNQNCCVKWNSKSSTDFCVSNGVKQWAVISPILFISYMDALFERLKRNAIGCHVGPVYAGAFEHADNVALVAPSLYNAATPNLTLKNHLVINIPKIFHNTHQFLKLPG